MKISKNSWHYRLVDSICNKPSKNLCTYFWQIPFALSVWAAIGMTLGIAALGCLWMILSPIALLYTYITDMSVGEGVLVGMAMGTLCVAVFAILFVLNYLIDKWKNKAKSKGILPEYLKAKKDKICPVIDFEDDK